MSKKRSVPEAYARMVSAYTRFRTICHEQGGFSPSDSAALVGALESQREIWADGIPPAGFQDYVGQMRFGLGS